MECGDGSGGGDAIARIARASDEDADEAQCRQTAEDKPKRIEEEVGVTSVDESGKEEDHAMGEPAIGRKNEESLSNHDG